MLPSAVYKWSKHIIKAAKLNSQSGLLIETDEEEKILVELVYAHFKNRFDQI